MVVSRHSRPARIALGLLLAAALVSACGDSSGAKPRANVQFSLGSTDTRLASALSAPAIPPAAIVLSIETMNGEVVHDMLRMEVYAFGPTYVSQQVELEVGRYRLTRFLVVDAQNQTIYAAPNAGDPSVDPLLLARVLRPLPIIFDVSAAVLHSQAVEILPIGEHSPQQFGYTAFTFRINAGPRTSTRSHYGPGADGIFFTEDDEVTGYNYVEFDAQGDSETDRWYAAGAAVDGRGPDGVWFTPDDVPMGWWWQHSEYQYGANHSGPGADGIWVSDDDPITSWEAFEERYEHDGSILNGVFTDPGPDGYWVSPDDVRGGYLKRELNPNGAELRRIRYSSAGMDGVWFTSDDEIGQDWFGAYVVNTYPAGNSKWGSWTRQVSYTDPGWDYEWLTADDVPGRCLRHEFGDGTEYWTREIVTAPGWDETCFTTDDSVIGYSLATNVY